MKKIKKLRKKIIPIITSSVFIVSASGMVVASTLSSVLAIPSNTNGKRIIFDNKVFNSSNELITYVRQEYLDQTITNDNRIQWSIDEKGDKVYFNDPTTLRKHLLDQITYQVGFSSQNISYDEHGVSSSDLSKLYFSPNKDQIQKTIYRGKNNSIHTSETAAKDSYLSIHDAYYFNNIYFRNIEELKLYLQTVYYVPGGPGRPSGSFNGAKESIGIVGPDGIVSSGIDPKDLFRDTTNSTDQELINKTKQAKKDFINNVNVGAKKYLEIDKGNNEYFYVNFEDLNNPSAEVLNAFDNPEYTKITSNEGVSTYIVDLHKDDENTLFGSYYAKSSGDLSIIQDNKNWKQVDKNDPLIAMETESSTIAPLIDMILFEDKELDEEMPLNIKYLNDDHIQPFIKLLKASSPKIYKEWIEFSISLKSGKNYNSFYSLPIYFVFLIDKMITYGVGQNLIIETKKLFTTITDHLDSTLEIIIPKDLLRKTTNNDEYGKYLSFSEIFNFSNNDFNLNVELPYFMKEISQNFSQFIVASNIISQANINSIYNGGSLPFRIDFIKNLFPEYKQNIVLSSNEDKYRKLWNTFSATNLEDFKKSITSNSAYAKTVDVNFLDDFIVALGTTNAIFSSSNEFLFQDSIPNISLYYNEEYSDYVLRGDDVGFFKDLDTIITKKILVAKNNITYKNFMLIKFLYKNNRSSLSTVDSFNLQNQNQLSSILIDLVLKTNITSFITGFMIDPDALTNLASFVRDVSKVKPFLEFSKDFLDLFTESSWKETQNMITTTISQFSKVMGSSKFINKQMAATLLNSFKAIKALTGLAKCVPYLQVAMLVIDAALFLVNGFIPKTEYSSYEFQDESNNKYVWNGGQRTTTLFGFLETSRVTVDDMKLIPPQELVKGSDVEELYFNGKRYSSTTGLNELKRDQLKAILNGELVNDNFKIVYSYDDISTGNQTTHKSSLVYENFGTINDLISVDDPLAYNSLIQMIYNEIRKTLDKVDKKYHTSQFSFANGVIASTDEDITQNLIQEVVSKIRPVKIALLPKTIDGKPIYSENGNDEDGSVPIYQLPSTSWSYEGFKVNNTDNEYIIYDPNQVDKNGIEVNISNDEIMRKIKTLFYASFDVDSKDVIENEILTHNVFSELSSSIITNIIYKVTLDNNMTRYFINKGDAFKWLLANKNFTLYSYTTETEIYKYKDMVFNSRDEFINFILEESSKGGK